MFGTALNGELSRSIFIYIHTLGSTQIGMYKNSSYGSFLLVNFFGDL